MTPQHYFQTELDQNSSGSPTLIVEILQPVGSLADTSVMEELDRILEQLQESDCHRVIVDFRETSYFGSSLLEALRLIWNKIRTRDGRMVLCRLSPVGKEILQVARFDHLWPITTDRTAAFNSLQAVH